MPMVRHKNPNPEAKGRIAMAPYNFVPLPNAVLYVEDDERFRVQVGKEKRGVWQCHDRFVPDLHSGRIDLTVETLSPMFIRAPQSETRNGWGSNDSRLRPEPAMTADGRPLIPGSSFRGMLRSLVEILAFAKPQPVSNHRPFFRSVGKDRMADQYRKQVVNGNRKPIGGFIRKLNGEWRIEPAAATLRVSHDVIAGAGLKAPEPRRFLYEAKPQYKPDWEFQYRRCWVRPDDSEVLEMSFSDTPGWSEGVLVLTGAAGGKKPKTREFVFLTPGPGEAASRIVIPDWMWKRFHDDDQISQWQERAFPKNEPTERARDRAGFVREGEPVFYVAEKTLVTDKNPSGLLFFGRAQLFRLPYDLSPHDLILSGLLLDKLDLAEALFGCVTEGRGENQSSRAVRGRVRCGDLTAEPRTEDYLEPVVVPQILSSPKPTAFQQYLVQDGTADPKMLKAYFAGDPTTIRGHKLYWHRWDSATGLAGVRIEEDHDNVLAEMQAGRNPDKYKQYTLIRPVGSGVTLKGSVAFDNLTAIELGALLAALALPEGAAHAIGMAKPLGLGVIRVTPILKIIDRRKRYATWSDDGSDAAAPDDFTKAFAAAVTGHARSTGETIVSEGLWGIARLDVLRVLLEYPTKQAREDTRYLMIQGRDDKRYEKGKEFAARPVLPTPHFVANINEPEWNDMALRSSPPSSAGHAKSPVISVQRREVDNNEIVDVVVRDEKTKKGGLTFDIAVTKQVGVLDPASYQTLPEDLRAPGTKLKLRVKRGGSTPQLEWIDPNAPPPAPPTKGKSGGPRRK
jgi:CRISPR-associated protein (TIGR03986 family)